MTDSIPLTGLTSTWRVPDTYIELVFGEGPSSGGQGEREVLFVLPKLSSGTYTANTIYRVNSASEVVAGAGAKSAASRAIAYFMRCNKSAKINVLCYPETTGGTPVKAVTTDSLAGTATAPGALICSIGRRTATVTFYKDETAETVMGRMRSALSSISDIPVAISGSTTSCTFTASQFGIRGGTVSYKPIRIRWNTPGMGLTVTAAGDLGATTPGADGTTTEADQIETALAANVNVAGKYYIVTDFGVAAGLEVIKTWLAGEATPLTGHRAVAVCAYVGTKANAITLANTLNYERLAIGYGAACKEDPTEICAQLAAIYQKREATDPAFNFDDYSGSDWLLNPAANPTEWISESDVNDLINGGLVPIRAKTGKTQHVFGTTTRVLDSTGTYSDYRTYERHRVSAADAWVESFQRDLNDIRTGDEITGGAKTMVHPLLANGKPDPNAKIGRGVVTTFTLEGTCKHAIRNGVAAGLLQRPDDSIESLAIVRSTDNTGRITIAVSAYTIDLLHQLAVRVAESTAG
jgi:phage tail sheath gpL-like